MGWDLDNLNFLLLYDERFSKERAICIDFSTLFRRYGVTFKKWPSFQPFQNQKFKWLKRKLSFFIWRDIYAALCFLFHQNNTKIDEMVAILEKIVFVTENGKSQPIFQMISFFSSNFINILFFHWLWIFSGCRKSKKWI